jgi:hypothetical protein
MKRWVMVGNYVKRKKMMLDEKMGKIARSEREKKKKEKREKKEKKMKSVPLCL